MRGRKLLINWQDDAEAPRELYRGEHDAEVKPRLHALWLLRAGHSLREIAELVGCHYVTLQQWVAWYRTGGVAEIRRHSHRHGPHQGQPSKVTPEQIEQLKHQAALGTFRTAHDIDDWLEATFDVHYRPRSIYGVLTRLGWKPKLPRPQALNAPLEEQQEWKKGG